MTISPCVESVALGPSRPSEASPRPPRGGGCALARPGGHTLLEEGPLCDSTGGEVSSRMSAAYK